jgi:CRISPR-associated protein Csy1
VIYHAPEAVRAARERVESGLRELLAEQEKYLRLSPAECFDQLFRVNFFLAYQGLDDTTFQRDYGDFVTSLIGAHLPALSQTPPQQDARGRRIRVGFASGYFRQCTVGGYFRRWVTHLDRRRFETFVFHSSPRRDAMTREIAAQCDHFIDLAAPGFGSLETCGKRIRAEKLDVLIYPELGMDAHSFLLATLRLAPLQCAGWGHPVTSGLASIDYFLSSRAAEPADAAAHYREKLVLLDGLGVSYPRPLCPNSKNRGDFGLPASKTLYLCPQSLFKLHPDFDALLARVLTNDADGVLVLFAADNPALTSCFIDRLTGVFARYGLDIRQRVVVLPYLRHPDYLEVNRLCDVMLDPPHWSGGNTALDALASGLPIVTFNGRFMRGRQSAAMLKQVGLAQLIARDADDYARIAHALAHDSAWRDEIQTQLRARVDTLFDQAAAIASLQRFLEQITHA